MNQTTPLTATAPPGSEAALEPAIGATADNLERRGILYLMERPLDNWETAVIVALSTVEAPRIEIAREAIDHLVVTAVCECGCGSFNVRDVRHPPQPHELRHVSNGVCGDVGFAFFVGRDDRPISVDVFLPDDRTLAEYGPPDPDAVEVRPVP